MHIALFCTPSKPNPPPTASASSADHAGFNESCFRDAYQSEIKLQMGLAVRIFPAITRTFTKGPAVLI